MAEVRDWKGMRDMSIRLLKERTGEGVSAWNQRIRKQDPKDEKSLRAWLTRQGVTGYAQSLLVMETFGYPDFMVATANQLLDAMYADRPRLKRVYNAIIAAATSIGEVDIQTRKTYVSLVTPRRTFARIQPTTKDRVDLGLRIPGMRPGGRLQPSKIHESMEVQISLSAPEEVDREVRELLEKAYELNC
jgi:hypothetical protein